MKATDGKADFSRSIIIEKVRNEMMKRIILVLILLAISLSGCSKEEMSEEEIFQMVKENNSAEKLKERFKDISYFEEEGYSVYDDKEKTVRFYYDDKGFVNKIEKAQKDFLYTMHEDASYSQEVILNDEEDVWAKSEELLDSLVLEKIEETDAFYILSAHVDQSKLSSRYGQERKIGSASMDLLCDENGIITSIQNETLTYEDGTKEALSEFEVHYDEGLTEEEAYSLLEDHFNKIEAYRRCTVVIDEQGKDKQIIQYNIPKGDKSGVVLKDGFVLVNKLSTPDDERSENDVSYYVTNKDTKEMEKEHEGTLSPDNVYTDDASGFVALHEAVPEVLLEIRYATSYNFVGEPIDGYEEPLALLSKPAASALKKAAQELKKQGYLLKIYDAYRPQRAVEHFKQWAAEINDTRMKDVFYPDVDKKDLFDLGYVAEHSSHSRGSTVDLTLVDMKTGKDIDMGSGFDWFAEVSHSDYADLSQEQLNNRKILKDAMEAQGFKVLEEEWWHFTLQNEPYPQTYFEFAVSMDSFDE